MILQSLVALRSQIAELAGDDAFENKRLDFLIAIDGDGKVLGLESQRGDNNRGRIMRVPRLPLRTVAVSPGFLVDNAKYVLGLDDESADKRVAVDRLAQMRRGFEARIVAAQRRVNDERLGAVVAFYQDIEENVATVLELRPRSEWDGSELIAFRVNDDLDPVHLTAAAALDWSTQQGQPVATTETDDTDNRFKRCLVTGAIGPTARLHPMLKRVPGGLVGGTSLVSFNSRSFESQGLEQGDNAPISRTAANAYVDVLNWMLAEDPTLGKARPHRYGIRLGEDSVALFWTDGSRPAMDAFAAFAAPPSTPHEAIDAYRSAWTGLAPIPDETPFYTLVLGGNSARAVVRAWIATDLGSIKRALRRYFDDLALPSRDDRSGEAPLSISRLIRSLEPPGRSNLPPELNARLFRASIDAHGALPREILRWALVRLRIPPAGDARDRKNPDEMLHLRCALIKATLRGIARSTKDTARRKDLEVQMALDMENKNPGYVLGRLFAVLERVQGAAMNDLNASIRDRYFGGASSSPATVFGRLLSLSTKHLAKLGGGLEHYFDERLRVVMRSLDGASMPSHLGLEDQGLFAVGYFHERDWLIQDARERSEKKKQNELA